MTSVALPRSLLVLRIGILFVVSFGGGLMLGLGIGVLSFLVYLAFLFPCAVGFASGLILDSAIRRLRLAYPALAGVAGGMIAFTTYAVYHVVHYVAFQVTVVTALSPLNRPIDIFALQSTIDAFLVQQTGASGFWGYLQYRADADIAIGSFFSTSAIPIGTTATWVYWGSEVVTIASIAIWMAVATAREPFCTHCQCWCRGVHVGSVAVTQQNAFLALLATHAFADAQSFIQEADVRTPSLEIYIQRCPRCDLHPISLSIRRMQEDSRGKLIVTDIVTYIISAEEQQLLVRSAI